MIWVGRIQSVERPYEQRPRVGLMVFGTVHSVY